MTPIETDIGPGFAWLARVFRHPYLARAAAMAARQR
jgi:hypothetical protein